MNEFTDDESAPRVAVAATNDSDVDSTELAILRLAAMAIDLRGQLPVYQAVPPASLSAVLDACDRLFAEMGWGDAAGVNDERALDA